MLDHQFTGTPFTVGIEEELMILDPGSLELASRIEDLLDAVPAGAPGEVKPELMESVLEVATDPCADIAEAERQLRSLRRQVSQAAGERDLLIGSSGTHPFSRWEDQRIVARPRYRELVSSLRFVARQEIIFGVHVHIGMNGADRAVYVADGMRQFLPLLLALSSNSPLWRGYATGMMSTRTPIFRQFPRVGIPRAYGDWEGFASQVRMMMDSGMVPDYTYLWWDVRPHPNLGTVEVRIFDAQTRVEHTVALAALTQAMMHRLSAAFDDGEPPADHPRELIDENKMLAALSGVEGELIDLTTMQRLRTGELARRVLDAHREHAEQLGTEEQLRCVEDLLEHGTGARRQLVVYEANEDLRELMRELAQVSGESS